MEKPIPTPMPADLPENWTDNQFVSPGGTEVGLSEKHGYNYQSKQINDAQKAINLLNDAFLNAYGKDNRDVANEDILLAPMNTAPATDLPTDYPKGVRVYLETIHGQFPNKPSEYGLIFSIRNNDEVSQLWFTQATGALYYRGGNHLGWASEWISLSNKADVVNGTVLSENASYAEVGEWADGNESDEDRIGYFVSVDPATSGTTMVKSTSTMDVRGVTVKFPAFSGNCAAEKFEENGNLLKQYDYVAVMGLVSVIDNGTCTINGRCMPNDSGTAVPSSNNMGYQVISRIDSTHILIAVEPSADMIQRIKTDVGALQTDVSELQTDVGAVQRKAEYLSNHNLLDNWDFRNPVNQRGQTSYNGGYKTYSVDRWFTTATNQTVNVKDGYIEIVDTEGCNSVFEQSFNVDEIPWGQTVTISFDVEADTPININFNGWDSNNNDHTNWWELGVKTVYTREIITFTHTFGAKKNYGGLTIQGAMAGTLKVYRVKMELGNVSTLANDAPANYSEQLARCQRYYLGYVGAYCSGEAGNRNEAWINIPVPVPMRTVPSVIIHNYGRIGVNGSTNVPSDITVAASSPSGVVLHMTVSSTTAGWACALNDFDVSLSADI